MNKKDKIMNKIIESYVPKAVLLTILFAIALSISASIASAIEPVVIRVLSADPSSRTYTFACLDNGSGLSGKAVRNWFIYPEDTGVDELVTTLPWNQTLTYTFNRTAYYDVSCNVPNPPGLNYTSLYRHSLHIDLRTQLDNPSVIPLSVAPGQITEKCLYNGTNYSMSWFVSTYGFTGGSGNTMRYSLNNTNSTVTFNAPFTPSLFDTHCLIHFSDGRKDIDLPWAIDFPAGNNNMPYVADQFGISPVNNFAPFDYNTWISLHNGNGTVINSTNTTGTNSTNSTNTTNTTSITSGNINLTTTPGGASVSLNTIPAGITDAYGTLFISNISAGNDNISITLIGYLAYQNVVSIIAGQTTSLTVILLQNITTNQTNTTNTTTYTNMKDIPSSCIGGSISSDVYNGGRTISCANGSSNISVTVWNKPSNTAPQYFEMYKQSQSGVQLKICLLGTCISNGGYAKSPNFPIIG